MSTLSAPAAAAKDVQASLMRNLTPAESTYVGTLLTRVHNRIGARLPDLIDRADRDETVGALLVEVEAEAVARVFRADGGHLHQRVRGRVLLPAQRRCRLSGPAGH